jgi:hypothetical protein
VKRLVIALGALDGVPVIKVDELAFMRSVRAPQLNVNALNIALPPLRRIESHADGS